jgi:hypothetical protein
MSDVKGRMQNRARRGEIKSYHEISKEDNNGHLPNRGHVDRSLFLNLRSEVLESSKGWSARSTAAVRNNNDLLFHWKN